MLLAVSALVLSLLQQIEEASHAEPPVFQVETLLQTASLLPAGAERRAMITAALRANTAVRDTEERERLQVRAAHLSEKRAAARQCATLRGVAAIRCWLPVEPMEGVRVLSYEDEWKEQTSHLLAAPDAAKALKLLDAWRTKTVPVPPRKQRTPVDAEIARKMDRVDKSGVSEVENSRLLREVMEVSETIEDTTERLLHQGYIAAWFAAHGEEATAALAAEKLQKTFDGVCGERSAVGWAECSENIDFFADFLGQERIDPAALRIRHPSLAARALVVKLKGALK